MTVIDPIEMARSLQSARRFPEAETLYRQVLARDPYHVLALDGLGWLAHELGKHDIAAQLITQAIEHRKNDPELHLHLAVVKERLGDIDGANAAFARAVELRPKDREMLNRWGVFLASNGRLPQAAEVFRRLCKSHPNYAGGYRNLGLAHEQMNQFAEAEEALRKGLELEPSQPSAWASLARLLGRAKRFDESLQLFHKALELDPYHFDANLNLGIAYRILQRLDEAIAPLERALTARPGSSAAMNELAKTYSDIGDFGKALPLFDTALTLNPNDPDLHGGRSVCRLAMGDLLEGFREYEWRWKCTNFSQNRRYTYAPQWTGFDISGKTILLHAEQGFGDTFQFLRYVPLIAQRGARVVMMAGPEVAALYETIEGMARVINDKLLPEKFDVQCPLMSLPLAFGTTLETVPNKVPYMHSDPAKVALWKPKLDTPPGVRKIGLVWAGRPQHARDADRSMPSHFYSALAEVPNTKFFSLQVGRQTTESIPDLDMVKLGPEIRTFMDTAAIIDQLDLVITIDSAVAHLTGALGRPVWTLIGAFTDFRWMMNRDDSPWYPTMRLFRQQKLGDWATLIQRVVQALRQQNP